MLDSTKKPSIYGNRDFLELVWGNGQIHGGGGGGGGGGSSNNRTQNTNSLSIGYSINPTSHKNEDDHHVSTTTTTKRARLRSTSSNSLLDHHHFPYQTQKDSDIMTYSHHQSNNTGQVSSQSKSSFKSTSTNEVFFPNLRPLKDSNHMSTYTSSQNCCFPSSSSSSPNFKKPRIDPGQTRVVNFSNFSIPAMFLKSTTTHQNSAINIASSSARRVVEEIKSKAAVIDTVQEQGITATKSDPAASLVEKSSAEVITNSEAVIREKRKLANTNPRAAISTSVCSLEASNDPNFGSIRTFEEDTDDSTYFSDNEEETENIVREKATHHGLKRFRNAEIHNLSERRRRDKINEKIRKLKELVPNCDKVDKASMLDDAIDYLKTLKLQLEIASMGRGLCMPPMMMLPPPPPHHMNAAQLMGFRPPQFTNNIFPAVLPPAGGGVTDNILQMFGFSNQIIPPAAAMPIPPNAAAASSPFINPMMMMIGNSSSTQQPPLIMETTNNLLARHMANPAGQLTTQDYVHLSKLDNRD